jgi:hypothetical protein
MSRIPFIFGYAKNYRSSLAMSRITVPLWLCQELPFSLAMSRITVSFSLWLCQELPFFLWLCQELPFIFGYAKNYLLYLAMSRITFYLWLCQELPIILSASRMILVRSVRETSKGIHTLLPRATVFRRTVNDCTLSFIYLF